MPQLLTYDWSPNPGIAAAQGVAAQNEARTKQALNMAMKLLEDRQQQEALDKKLQYDAQQQARRSALEQERFRETVRHNTASEMIMRDRAGVPDFVPLAIPVEDAPLPSDPAPTTPTTPRPAPISSSLSDLAGPLPSEPLNVTDQPLMPEPIAPGPKRAPQSMAQQLQQPFTAEETALINRRGQIGGPKAASQAAGEITRSKLGVDAATQKAALKAPPADSGAVYETVEEAATKATELKADGFNAAPMFSAKTGKYALKFYSVDEDENARKNAKAAATTLNESVKQGEGALKSLTKRHDDLKKQHPIFSRTTGIFTDDKGVIRFGEPGVKAEKSEKASPELIRAYHEFQGLSPLLETQRQQVDILRGKRTDYDDIADKGFSSDFFTRKPDAPAEQAPPGETKTLDRETAKKLIAEAGGDREKARALAKSRGYVW